jgi:hypothetical protein
MGGRWVETDGWDVLTLQKNIKCDYYNIPMHVFHKGPYESHFLSMISS